MYYSPKPVTHVHHHKEQRFLRLGDACVAQPCDDVVDLVRQRGETSLGASTREILVYSILSSDDVANPFTRDISIGGSNRTACMQDGGLHASSIFSTKEVDKAIGKLLPETAKPLLATLQALEDTLPIGTLAWCRWASQTQLKKAGSHAGAKLAKPEPGNLICDPTCGSGSLALDTARELPDNACRLFGQEKNGSTLALAKMNM